MSLLQNLRLNFTSISHYDEVIKKPFSFSFKIFLSFFLVYGLVSSIIISIGLVPTVKDFLDSFAEKAVLIYPEELVLNIKNGEVSTNVVEPYFINFDRLNVLLNSQSSENPEKIENYLMVIDTKGNVEDYFKYKTMGFLTKESLSFENENGILQTFPLKEVKDFTLNKDVFNLFIDKIASWINTRVIIPLLVGFIFLAMAVFLPIVNLVYLLLFSLIILITAKIVSLDIDYKQSYQIGIHGIILTTPIFWIANYITDIFYITPYLQSLFLLVFCILILLKIKDKRADMKTEIPQAPLPQS